MSSGLMGEEIRETIMMEKTLVTSTRVFRTTAPFIAKGSEENKMATKQLNLKGFF